MRSSFIHEGSGTFRLRAARRPQYPHTRHSTRAGLWRASDLTLRFLPVRNPAILLPARDSCADRDVPVLSKFPLFPDRAVSPLSNFLDFAVSARPKKRPAPPLFAVSALSRLPRFPPFLGDTAPPDSEAISTVSDFRFPFMLGDLFSPLLPISKPPRCPRLAGDPPPSLPPADPRAESSAGAPPLFRLDIALPSIF